MEFNITPEQFIRLFNLQTRLMTEFFAMRDSVQQLVVEIEALKEKVNDESEAVDQEDSE